MDLSELNEVNAIGQTYSLLNNSPQEKEISEEEILTPRNLFEKYIFSEEQKRYWRREIFSWGFKAGMGGSLTKQIFEVQYLAQIFSEGYYLGIFLKTFFNND